MLSGHSPVVKKRKFFEARYTSEIKDEDIITLRRPRRALYLARSTIRRQKTRINSMKVKVARLKARVTSMKKMISALRKKNLISEESGDSLMVCA